MKRGNDPGVFLKGRITAGGFYYECSGESAASGAGRELLMAKLIEKLNIVP